MKDNKKFSALIAFIVLAAIDAVILILTKQGDYDTQFWMGFAFIQVSFVVYILCKIFVKEKEEERGIRPLDTVLFMFMVVMVLMGLLAFLAPYNTSVFKTLLIFYIIITALCICCGVLAFLNKKIIKENSYEKPRIFNRHDIVKVLEDVKILINDSTAIEQVQSIIDKVNGIEFDMNSLKGKQLVEYTQFMYKNATRQEINNMFNNINKVNEILNELIQ